MRPSLGPVAPAVGSIDQVEPFQASTNVDPMPVAYTTESPTATQAVALRHVTPLRTLFEPATLGDGVTDHEWPSHDSTSVRPELSQPTATQSELLTQVTSDR